MAEKRKRLVWIFGVLAVLGIGGVIAVRAYQSAEKRREMKSSGQMKLIGHALGQFASEHRGEYPDSLDEIRPYLVNINLFYFPFVDSLEFDRLMTNPLTGDFPGYGYIKPNTLEIPDNQIDRTVVLYQLRKGQRAQDLPVGLLSGSVRRFTEE